MAKLEPKGLNGKGFFVKIGTSIIFVHAFAPDDKTLHGISLESKSLRMSNYKTDNVITDQIPFDELQTALPSKRQLKACFKGKVPKVAEKRHDALYAMIESLNPAQAAAVAA